MVLYLLLRRGRGTLRHREFESTARTRRAKWDFATIKNVQLGAYLKFQLRGEYFNIFNHANFSGVDSGLADGNFGQVTSAHEPRIIQVAGKLYF